MALCGLVCAQELAVLGLVRQAGEPCGGSAVVVAPGRALTLVEALPASATEVMVVCPPGVRRVAVVLRRCAPIIVLSLDTSGLTPVRIAAREPELGQPVMSLGNAVGAIEDDGVASRSVGTVSGRYDLPAGVVLRGRGGRVLGPLFGPVIETDAAVNDGDQGGALVDADGGLVGLISLAMARERRLGTALPIARALELAQLDLPRPQPYTTVPVPAGVVRLALNRPFGPGNPPLAPRPALAVELVPRYEQDTAQRAWDLWWHAQQIAYGDHPVSGLVIDAAKGLVLTTASNLHGGARDGRVLSDDLPRRVRVLAVHLPLDLALLAADKPFPTAVTWTEAEPRLGDAVAVIARHAEGWTRTGGRVSVVDRRVHQAREAFIQTDARAGYGSLGGALVDARGEVAGMVVHLGPTLPWLPNSGVAVAARAADIQRALPDLIAGRSLDRLKVRGLGVRFAEDGLVVVEVVPGSGAAQAGVRLADRVLAVDDLAVASPIAIQRALIRLAGADSARVRLLRDGRRIELSVPLREFE